MITISTPNYEIVTVNGKDYVIFYPQFLKDGDWATVGDENPLPVKIVELDTVKFWTEQLLETSEKNKEKLEQLNELISEMSMLSKGPKGDTRYMWIKYADDEKGTGMSDDPNDKKYIGMAFNKDVETPSNDPKDYVWTKYVADFEALEIGVGNLVLDSSKGWKSTEYLVMQGHLSEDWVVGQTYTVVIKGSINEGQSFRVWRDIGYKTLVDLEYDEGKDLWIGTAVAQETEQPNKRLFTVYNYHRTGATEAEIEWIKITKGNQTSLDWLPALEDINKDFVGLGNVQNYGIALQSQAEAGVSNAVYMTPLRTKQAIDHQRPTLIDRKSGNATADKYPLGLSFMDINGNGTSDGYPQNYGTVITYKTHNNRTSQEFIGNGFNSSQEVKYTRHYHTSNDYGGWTPWQQAVYVDVEMGDDYMVKRFADGTMELSGMQEFNNVSYNSAGAIYRSGGLNVDYPVEFADDNVCVTLSSSSSSHWVDLSGNGSATGFPFRSFSYNSDSLDFIVRYQATGRWR